MDNRRKALGIALFGGLAHPGALSIWPSPQPQNSIQAFAQQRGENTSPIQESQIAGAEQLSSAFRAAARRTTVGRANRSRWSNVARAYCVSLWL